MLIDSIIICVSSTCVSISIALALFISAELTEVTVRDVEVEGESSDKTVCKISSEKVVDIDGDKALIEKGSSLTLHKD